MSEPATIQAMPGARWNALIRGLLLLPAITALATYVTTLSRGAFPGESARLLVQATGLAPRLYIDRPLWTLVVSALARLPSADFAFWFNLFSACCAAIAVYLCTRLVHGLAQQAVPHHIHRLHPKTTALAALAGGLVAGLFLAFAIPFWMVATRIHPLAMHLAGFLFVATLLFNYTQQPTDGRLALLVFFYGLGCVEFGTFLVFAPLFGVFLLLFLWLRNRLTLRRILLMTASGLAGLALVFPAAWMVMRTEGYLLRDFQGFWHVILVFWGDQYRFIRHGLPQFGWMLMLTMTFIPWLIGVLTLKRALSGDRQTAFRLLHLVLTALTLMVLFNHSIAPWSLFGMRRLLVTPYLLSAVLFGFLAASWILFPLYCTEKAERGWKYGVQRFGGLLPAALSLAVVVWAPFRNLSIADGRTAEVMTEYAEHIARSAVDREWLITDGTLDDHILIAAHTAGQPLKLLDVRSGHSRVYQRYLVNHFESARLHGLLELGIQPFLREWLATPGIEERVAMLVMPDLLLAADLVVVPHRLVFRGARAEQLPDPEQVWDDHVGFWDEIGPMLRRHRDSDRPFRTAAAAQFLRHTSLTANNLGVLFEDIGRGDLAWQAYRQAREFDNGNISALLNLSILATRDDLLPEHVAAETRADMARLADSLGEHRFQIRRLSQIYGYVRTPHAFADMGWTWAMSGNPGMAVSGMQRALAMADGMEGVRSALAGLYLTMERDVQSETVYREMLVKNPQDQRALAGLARVALFRRQYDLAGEYITAAEQAGMPRPRILFERAMIAVLTGEDENARELLDELVALQPENARAWILLAQIAMRREETVRLDQIIRRVVPLASSDHLAAYALGEIALVRGQMDEARQYFAQSLRIRPGNAMALEQLLRRDLSEQRYDLAEQHTARLLALDSDHPFGNYVLGVLQTREHRYAMAEDSFRRSLVRRRTPYSLHDLAGVLIEQERAAEAEPYIREAVEMQPGFSPYHTMLGRTLLHLQRLPEAVAALEEALMLNADNINATILLAEALAAQGEHQRALNRIAPILEPGSRANASQRERLLELKRAISRNEPNL